ncbi:MAG TPA: DUF1501 domain-containing protein [Isosphaeraceae bacterium]|nr:DUF1501 domain-containing protein [Isosphaeraceae bacterium]
MFIQTRRQFLGTGLSCVTLGAAVPGLFARAAEQSAKADQNDHALVVIELAGGNDGLNMVVPFEEPLYYKFRPKLAIPKTEVQKLDDKVGLHPRMKALASLFKDGLVTVVQGAGYPEPDRSHFRSMEIWHTASTGKRPPTSGWLGRYLDAAGASGTDVDSLRGLALTGALPQAFQSDRGSIAVVDRMGAGAESQVDRVSQRALQATLASARKAKGPVSFMRAQAEALDRALDRLKGAGDAYKSSVEYPEGELGAHLRRAAQLLAGRLGVRVVFISQGGYDTHAAQGEAHANLLGSLSDSLAAFQRDLAVQNLGDKVLVMAFSEFGRRVDENASLGTDHGAASSMLLLGSRAKGGLAGKYPSLATLGEGDLIYNTDFRRVYATLLEGWLGCKSETVLGERFEALDLLRTGV